MRLKKYILLLPVMALVMVSAPGCKEKSESEKAMDAANKAATDTSDAAKKAADDAAKAAKDAADKAKAAAPK